MSASELKQRAIRMARMDGAWRAETLSVVDCQRPYIGRNGKDVVDIKVLPGGQWVTALSENGKVHLQDWGGLANYSGPPPDAPASLYKRYYLGMFLAFTTGGVHWVVVMSTTE